MKNLFRLSEPDYSFTFELCDKGVKELLMRPGVDGAAVDYDIDITAGASSVSCQAGR
jgi:hypothetical protein